MESNLNLFDDIKAILSCEEVAEFYGLSIDHHKTHCIFHDERTPSLSFKDGYFKCFGCGKSGSVIDLTMELLSVSNPYEAIKRLDEDFGLDLGFELNFNNTIKNNHRKYKQELVEKFDLWWDTFYFELCDSLHFYQEVLDILKPKNVDELDKVSCLFHETLDKIAYYEYLLDYMYSCNRDIEMKIKFYEEHGEEEI